MGIRFIESLKCLLLSILGKFRMDKQVHKKVEPVVDIISQLADDCCRRWFENADEGVIDILIYPVVGISVEQLRKFIKIELPQQKPGWKGLIAAADIQAMGLLDFSSQVQANDKVPGVSFPSIAIRESNFKGPAIIVIMPAIGSENVNPISVLIPLLRLYRGSAIAWGHPHRMRYNGKTGVKYTPMDLGKPYSSDTEGPFDNALIEKHIAESCDSLFSSNNDNRDRVRFALELFTQANEPTKDSLRVRIFQYWSAIEVLGNSNETKILIRYLFDGKLDTKTPEGKFFEKVRILRHNVTHNGHNAQSDPHILERYLQVVFLDMMRFVIRLTYEGYLEKFMVHHGDIWFQESYKKIKKKKLR